MTPRFKGIQSKLNAQTKLDPMESVMVGFINDVFNYDDLLAVIHELPTEIINIILNKIYFQLAPHDGLNISQLNPNINTSREILLAYFWYSLAAHVSSIDPSKLEIVISLLRDKYHYDQDPKFEHLVDGLKVTFAVLKQQKTESDWQVIKAGSSSYINLFGAYLIAPQGQMFDLRKANLPKINVRSSLMVRLDLSGANLSDAIGMGAQIESINFSDANMSNFMFSDPTQQLSPPATVSDCTLNNVNLQNADLTRLINYKRVNLAIVSNPFVNANILNAKFFRFDTLQQFKAQFLKLTDVLEVKSESNMTIVAKDLIRHLRIKHNKRLANDVLTYVIPCLTQARDKQILQTELDALNLKFPVEAPTPSYKLQI